MNVLVATDGRAHSEKAVEYAFLLARAFRARLFVIYVVNTKSANSKDKVIKDGMRVLGRLKIKAADLGVEIHPLLEAGDAAETILAAADRVGANTVVVGRSAKSGISRIMGGGSVSETVLRGANCIVSVVK